MDEIFSFLIVRNSGHLLPMDLPKIGLELLNRFLHNETFADKSLPNEAYYIRELEKMQQADSEGAASPIMSGERGVSLVITVLLTALALALFLYTVYHLRPKIFK